MGTGKKKEHFTGQKTRVIPRKIARKRIENGKSGKNGDFGAKKMGWGRGEKMGFTADFAML